MTTAEMRPRPPGQRDARWTWSRWVIAMVVGELIGLGAAGVLAVVAVTLAGDDPARGVSVLLFALMLAAGAMEGVVLGTAQSFVLRRLFAGFASRSWILATAAGALVAWLVGAAVAMSFPEDADGAALLPVWMVLGLAVGTVLGVAQWTVLRRYVEHAGWWIAGNAAAWGVGLMVPFAGASIAPEETSLALLVALLTALLTGVAPGAVTGLVLVRLLAAGAVSRPILAR